MARYMQKGTTKFYFVPTIAGADLIPTPTEIGAGDYIGADIADVSGFNFENDPISTPDMDSTFDSSIPGTDKADNSSLTFYEHVGLAANTVKTLLAKGTTGYIVVFPYGIAGANPAANDECDVWPVQVASNSRAYSAGNEASKFTVMFSITAEPALDVEVTA